MAQSDCSSNLIIRFVFDDEHQVEWDVQSPQEVTFQDVLEVISEASADHLFVTSFEYKDEDGDRITVKSDEELRAMINFHMMSPFQNSFDEFISENAKDLATRHLLIYPKLSKHPRKRNKHDLKVAIAPTASSLLLAPSSSTQDDYQNGMFMASNIHRSHQASNSQGNFVNTQTQQASAKSRNFLPEIHSEVQQNPSASNCGPGQSLTLQLGTLGNDALMFLEILGNGHSGVVRKALHRTTNTVTAVKAITLDLTGEEQQQILRELEILRRCNGCPNIIAFYGAYFDENRVLLCTEFMDGGSLDRYGAIPESVLVNVASSISFGLRHLWSLRIMHRDVKPSNVLINTDGHIKLCDFGVSTQLVDSIAKTYVGTNAYMSPERIIGRNYTIYSDVWSFGISICELATGRFPYPQLASKIEGSKGILPMELMQCIVNDPPPSLEVEHFSPQLVDFAKCCLHKEASKRLLPRQLCLHQLVTSLLEAPQQHILAHVAGWIRSKLQHV